jgi:hypothetical protein
LPLSPAASLAILLRRCSELSSIDAFANAPTFQDAAYDYDGTKESEATFEEKTGQAPKQFARAFVQREPQMFGPSGTLQDLVEAMLKFWTMRTALWKAQYNSRKDALEKWLPETYDLSDEESISFAGIEDLIDCKKGDILDPYDFTFGEKDHQCTVILLPLTKLTKGFALKIMGFERCHEACNVSREVMESNLKRGTREIARSSKGLEVATSNIQRGSVAEMRAELGLSADVKASVKKRDILYFS